MSFENQTIYLKIPENFRNKAWSESFGEKVSLIKKGNFSKIVIDMKSCYWLDPLPLLSILVAVHQFTNVDCERVLILPGDIVNQKIIVKDVQQKIIAFLYSEGFIEAFLDQKYILKIGGKITSIDEVAVLALEYSSKIYFRNSSVLPVKILDLGHNYGDEDINKLVNDLIKSSEHIIENIVFKQNVKEVKKNIRLFLVETFLNVLQHAYQKEPAKKTCGLYVRFRKGLLNLNMTDAEMFRLKKAFMNEKEFCPKLDPNFGESTPGFFEIFVLDHGIGMSKSFLGEDYSKHRYPFRVAWSDSIDRGDRNKRQKKNTNYGGLYILHREISNGFVAALDENEWVGEFLPLKRKISDTLSVSSQIKLQGFSIIGRISWKVDHEIFRDWYFPDNFSKLDVSVNYYLKSLVEENDIYDKYFGKRLSELVRPIAYIRDNRFENAAKYFPPKYLEELDFDLPLAFYFPPEDLSKLEIHGILSKEFIEVSAKAQTLIVGDIDISQSNIFQYAINNAIFNRKAGYGFDKIILITRHLSVLVLEKYSDPNLEYYTYKINNELSKRYFNVSEVFDPSKSISSYLEFIKTHDSLAFWRNIFQRKDRESFFLVGDIIWYDHSSAIPINSYFNFSETISDSFSRKLYQLVLTRASCLRNDNGVQFISTDVLTEKIAFEINFSSQFFYSKKGTVIYLGSVILTGSTKTNYFVKNNDCDFYLNFFKNLSHNHRQKDSEAHFFIWPNISFISKTSEDILDHRRVGNLPAVAPHGWKYFTIPRYVHSNPEFRSQPISELFTEENIKSEKVTQYSFVSATKCSPPDTYNDWQTDENVSIGHFENNSYHDIYKIDIPYAFKQSWKHHTELACFLITEVMVAFGLTLNDVILNSHIFKNKLQLYIVSNSVEISGVPQADILVYPFHHSTDTIISLISTIFPDAVKDRIIPLISINRSKNNFPNFFSSQTINKIKTSSKEPNRVKKALIFDTFRISGKTILEIQNLLSICGYQDHSVINIVNRDMIPIHPGSDIHYKSFWRFDVPILGKRQNCLLCKGLERMKSIKPYITDNRLQERLDEWSLAWTSQFRYESDNSHHGLSSEPINFIKNGVDNKKNFGIYVDPFTKETKQIGGDKNKITLKNSYGLTIYSNEIFSMTTRDNVALEFSELNFLTIETKLQLLSTNLILFSPQFSKRTKLEYYSKIIDLVKNSETCNNYTSFAMLVLSSQDDLEESFVYEKIVEPGTSFLNTANTDMLLFLCEYAKRSTCTKILQTNEIKRLFSFVDDERDLYNQFHYELVNDYGSYHDRPIHIVLVNNIPTKAIYQMGYSSLKKLEFLLGKFYDSDFTNFENLVNNEGNKELINSQIAILKDKIDAITKLDNRSFREKAIGDEFLIRQKFKDVYSKFLEFHKALFINFDLTNPHNDFPIRKFFENLLKQAIFSDVGISKKLDKPKGDGLFEKWTIWNTSIIWLIMDVLSNVRHVTDQKVQKIPDPYDSESELKGMWIFTDYNIENFICLNFVNLTSKSIDEIAKLSKSKLMLTKINILKLKGDLYHDDVSDQFYTTQHDLRWNVLKTVIKLPIL